MTQTEVDVLAGRLAPSSHPATRRTIWFTIVNATSYPASLPVPSNVLLIARAPIVSLTLDTAAEAETWARWVDVDYRTSLSEDGSVTFFAERSGWKWQIHCWANPVEQQERVAQMAEVAG